MSPAGASSSPAQNACRSHHGRPRRYRFPARFRREERPTARRQALDDQPERDPAANRILEPRRLTTKPAPATLVPRAPVPGQDEPSAHVSSPRAPTQGDPAPTTQPATERTSP